MFAQDQLVVYPAQGVGKVERIETQTVGGTEAEFYFIRILSNNVTLMVPVTTATNVLRPLCTHEQALDLIKSLDDRSGFTGYTGQNWNRRYREYSDKLKSGALEDVAYVLKELLLIGKDKELSFGERRLLEQAMGLITLEVAHATDTTQDAVQKQIEEMFADVIAAQEKK